MERQIAIWLLLASWALLSAPACESEPEIPEEELRARLASAICDNIGPCCEADGFPWDAASCRQSIEVADVVHAHVPTGVANFRVVYDARQAERCVATYKAIVSACDETGHDIQEACGGIYRGTLREGAACTSGIECSAPPGRFAVCDSIIADNGRCATIDQAPHQRGVLDGDCSRTCTGTPDNSEDSNCDQAGSPICWTGDGLHCDLTVQRCAPLSELGEPCQFLGCVAGAFCESGVCVAQRSSGPCSEDTCSSDAYCEVETGNCALKKPNGESCNSNNFECSGGRCNSTNLVCENDTVASATLCAGN